MARPLLWIEVRCDQKAAPECWESGGHDWANRAADMDDLVRESIASGWKVINGELVCPECVKHGPKAETGTPIGPNILLNP
ncbi:hypothetical protein [Phaeobacter gallaeciensis]|uniref:hypothetical protein n=1 Tax=Phaeobacter gallaeciensis TaxID=60890 RepID=UPI00237F2E6D|nr:hypothetical protein [Phaeobacter gallaeciensis]MDE4309047.1 hypothetical protein [Phaeobacter gallaeciensis]MDE4313399.1 hypothetical protein [Phaeobacter gallaeciensis]MDE4317976.1 hypothetical protein [Phaeobacter gallaeciensis]MDE4322439.1 hypothetical protein [Phaeobacter gallaeciensis]MDE4326171.1 hypothetical protein [Phaeobacter gallaeciensis]